MSKLKAAEIDFKTLLKQHDIRHAVIAVRDETDNAWVTMAYNVSSVEMYGVAAVLRKRANMDYKRLNKKYAEILDKANGE